MAGLDNSRFGAAATAAPVLTASARPRRRRVKVFAQAFFKRLAERETASRGLSRLRQTQEGVRERARWALSQGEPSSGGAGARWAPFSADRAGRRDPLMASKMPRGFPVACLPCPRKRPPPFGGSGGGVSKLGATAPAPAATASGVCAACAAFLPPAAPVKAVELCSTPRSF